MEIEKSKSVIIIVDDEEIIRKLGKRVLEQMNYSVYETESSKDAVDYLKSRHDNIRLVILDIVMPDMGGGELGALMRKIKPDLKILFSSGYGVSEDIQKWIEAGNTDFIAKPFTRNDIVTKVRNLIEQ